MATTEQFKNAILSHGGIHGVRVALVDDADSGITVNGKWDGISTLNNFAFDKDGKSVTMWKSYNLSEGREVNISKLPGMLYLKFIHPFIHYSFIHSFI